MPMPRPARSLVETWKWMCGPVLRPEARDAAELLAESTLSPTLTCTLPGIMCHSAGKNSPKPWSMITPLPPALPRSPGRFSAMPSIALTIVPAAGASTGRP